MNLYIYIIPFFLLFSVLFQLIINAKLIHNKKYNYPIIDKEVFFQTIFILLLLLLFFFNFDMEGSSMYHIFNFNYSTKLVNILLTVVTILILPSIFLAFFVHNLNYIEFFSLMLSSLLAMFFLIGSSSLLSVFLALEMQTMCFYILAAYNKSSGFSSEAGLKYFIISAIFSGIFLIGVLIIYFCLGTVNFFDIQILTFFNLFEFNSEFNIFFKTGVLLTLFWFLFKLTCAPFHFWSPDVYEGSPLSATIFFSISPKISIVYIFIKWIDILIAEIQNYEYFLLTLGVLSCFIGTFFALSQNRIKRLIIYSSIAQVGFICTSIFIGNVESYVGAFVFLLIYIITSILVWNHIILYYFFQNGISKYKNLEIDIMYVSNYFDLKKKNIALAYSLILVFFSIAGIPPLFGFYGKFSVLFCLIELNEYFISILFILISSVSVYYYIKILKITMFETKNKNKFSYLIKCYISEDLVTTIICYINIIFILILMIGLFFPEDLYCFSTFVVMTI